MYTICKVWDNKGGLRSSAKIIHAIKFWKAVLIKEWHTNSSPNKYEYSGVLFCYDKAFGSIGSYRIDRIKGIWYLYCS